MVISQLLQVAWGSATLMVVSSLKNFLMGAVVSEQQ